jgi:LPXTG-motif cell wall-anchored protein
VVGLDLACAGGLVASLEGEQLTIEGTLNRQEVAVVTYRAVIRPAHLQGDSRLRNLVDPSGAATDTPIGALDLLKTASPAVAKAGEIVTYTIDVKSVGTAPVEVDLTDYLSWVLDDADLVGEPSIDNPSLQVAHLQASPIVGVSGTLAPGEQAQVRYTVRVPQNVSGDDLMVNVVVEPNTVVPDGRPQCGAFQPGRCTATPVKWPDLPATGQRAAWAAGIAATVMLVAGGSLMVARRRRLRSLA